MPAIRLNSSDTCNSNTVEFCRCCLIHWNSLLFFFLWGGGGERFCPASKFLKPTTFRKPALLPSSGK
jgi:hypothetical protein